MENASVSKDHVNADQLLEGNWACNLCGWNPVPPLGNVTLSKDSTS